MTRSIARTILFLMLASAPAIQAGELVNKTFFGGLAAEGYDVVAYFTDGKPVKGEKQFKVVQDGATYLFASEDHRVLFEENPEKYLPAYGGYCAWAVAQGDTAGIDPEAWTIYQGRLYLNYSKKIRAKWEKDKDDNISKADANWPEIVAKKGG